MVDLPTKRSVEGIVLACDVLYLCVKNIKAQRNYYVDCILVRGGFICLKKHSKMISISIFMFVSGILLVFNFVRFWQITPPRRTQVHAVA